MRRLVFVFFIICLNIFFPRADSRGFQEPAALPSLISSIRFENPVDFCNEAVPFHQTDVLERFEKELLLTLWNRPQVILWLKRSGRYMPYIEETLKRYNMPEDLKYVAVVESALRPHVRSAKGAVGFWQFLPSTGQKYGLKINSHVDERRNIFKSTMAAIKYFKSLHDTFGSWTLSAAAYNMGEDGLETEILMQRSNDYYDLYLPLETQRFVFKIMSVKLILSNPHRYGFYLKKDDVYPALEFDRIRVDCAGEIPISLIARAAAATFKTIKDLNPEIRGYFMPKGAHTLLVPKGAEKKFYARYRALSDQLKSEKKESIYVVRRGDNLSSIAARFDIPLAALAKWNRLNLKQPIHPGQRLTIHFDGPLASPTQDSLK
jgi:peptidoglycan lytic transglycosylase D